MLESFLLTMVKSKDLNLFIGRAFKEKTSFNLPKDLFKGNGMTLPNIPIKISYGQHGGIQVSFMGSKGTVRRLCKWGQSYIIYNELFMVGELDQKYAMRHTLTGKLSNVKGETVEIVIKMDILNQSSCFYLGKPNFGGVLLGQLLKKNASNFILEIEPHADVILMFCLAIISRFAQDV